MSTSKRIVIATCLMLASVLLADSFTSHAAPDKPAQDVNVVNSPSVQINNQRTNPAWVRDAAEPVLQAYQEGFELQLPDGTQGENGGFNVPAGKRLVIDYVSASGFAPAGQHMIFSVFTNVNSVLAKKHFIAASQQSEFGASAMFTASQETRIYADPGTLVMVRAERDGATGAARAFITVSAHLVDLP